MSSTIAEQRARAEGEAAREDRYAAHREERRAIGARAAAEARLQAAFEGDLIELPALEARLAEVNRAQTVAEVDAAMAGVPDLEAVEQSEQRARAIEAARQQTALAPGEVAATGWAVAVMGGTQRSGRWRVPRKLRVVALMGGCDLDFTRAELGPVTDVYCVAAMGGVDIKVPAGLRVESNGIGLLGGFGHPDAADGDPSRPLLRIHGLAILGGVDIKTVAE